MASDTSRIIDDPQEGIFKVHRSSMPSPAILDLEWSKVFDRSWLYLGHEWEVPESGDYRRRTLAGRPLFFNRSRDGQVRVFLNRLKSRHAHREYICERSWTRKPCGTMAH